MELKIGDKVYARFSYSVESGVIVGIKECKLFKWVLDTKYLIKFDDRYYVDVRSASEIWKKQL